MDIKIYHDQESKYSKEPNAGISFRSRLWPGAVIPYTFSRDLGKKLQKAYFMVVYRTGGKPGVGDTVHGPAQQPLTWR